MPDVPEQSGVRGWRVRDLEVLATIADTFVPGVDGPEIALRAARVVALSLDPAQVRDLRLVLRAFDSRAANLGLIGRPVRFEDLDRGTRERYLARWGTSRISQRRAAFAAWRKLLTSLALSVPDAHGTNRYWEALGYRRDDPPVTDDPTPIRPLELPPPVSPPAAAGRAGRDRDRPDIELEADVVVVGSGAGGGVVAAELARAGRSVVVVEAGPFVTEAEMPRDELTAFDRLYLAHGLSATWDASVSLVAGAAVGGGTLVNWMTTIPAPDDVRQVWAGEHGLVDVVGPAWESDVAVLRAELGVTDATTIPPKDEAILRGAAALGWRTSVVPRNSPGCDDCGSCPFGCVRGTKQSGIRAHLASAHRAGARIVAETSVRRVLLAHDRVIGVEAVVGRDPWRRSRIEGAPDLPDPRRLMIRAPTVVVAAGALRTPVVLARSGIDHPEVGRNLRVHPVPVVVGRYPEPVEMWRGTMQAARVTEFEASMPGRPGYVIESAPGHPGLGATALPWSSAADFERLATSLSHLAPLVAITRDGGAGRVRPTGRGGVRIDYRLDDEGRATLRHALVAMARLARAAGAEEVAVAASPGPAIAGDDLRSETAFGAFLERLQTIDTGPNRLSLYSAHQMGTARAGADPKSHPCDPGGRVRQATRAGDVVGGLYVGDGSLFPSGIGVNPMLTIMALARGVARAVLADA
jgi:choline dehydrogenase-like flavoprotein